VETGAPANCPNALDAVRKLRGVRYRWGDAGLRYFTREIETSVFAGPEATDEQNQQVRQEQRRKALEALAGDRIGLVAQDLETALPELVREGQDGSSTFTISTSRRCWPGRRSRLTEAMRVSGAVRTHVVSVRRLMGQPRATTSSGRRRSAGLRTMTGTVR
jgi:hypothetical protein